MSTITTTAVKTGEAVKSVKAGVASAWYGADLNPTPTAPPDAGPAPTRRG